MDRLLGTILFDQHNFQEEYNEFVRIGLKKGNDKLLTTLFDDKLIKGADNSDLCTLLKSSGKNIIPYLHKVIIQIAREQPNDDDNDIIQNKIKFLTAAHNKAVSTKIKNKYKELIEANEDRSKIVETKTMFQEEQLTRDLIEK